jgi:RNA polymerase sigma-70 factor (TIGR02943 family)
MSENILQPEKWVDLYGDYLYNFAISRIYDPEVCEDLVQDTFLSAVKGKDGFLGKSTEKTWLTAILKRKVIDYYRKNSRNKEVKMLDRDDTFQVEGIMAGHWNEGQEPMEWSYDEPSLLENSEFFGTLRGCLSKLPPRWAAVFSMKEMDEMETEDVCKELGITPSNLWVMMHRAKVQLRKCIEKNWFMAG